MGARLVALAAVALGTGVLAAAPAGASRGPVVGPLLPPAPRTPTQVLQPAGSAPAATPAPAGAAAGDKLTGVFRVSAGACGGAGAPTGSYFRMIQPGGNASGPFVANSDSPCHDNTYTAVSPGTDGGLSTANYQPQPDPVFDGGNSRADRIVQPQGFFGAKFGAATNPTDPQTGSAVPIPVVTVAGGKLSGDLRAFAASWNGQHFNQGSPKPDGSHPGATGGPTGTYDATTGRYTLEWLSTVVGGPFNNFTGVWHLEGTFAAQAGAAAAPLTSQSAPAAAAGTSSSGSAAPPDVAASTATGTQPMTGLPFPDWLGPAFLATGVAGLLLAGRLRRRTGAGAGPS